MTSISTSPFHLTMLRKGSVWYSLKDGNFNDPATWLSNGRKRYSYPQSGDTVYVNHAVTINITVTVKHVFVSGILKFSNSTLTVNGDLQVSGTLDHTGINSYIILKGVNNCISNFLPGITSTIEYGRYGDQDIMYLPYYNLNISGGGNKYVYGELAVNGVTNINGNGGGSPTLYKATFAGKLTFVGLLTNTGTSTLGYIDNSINADVEFQSGISVDYRGVNFNFGSGNLYFNGPNVQIGFGGAISGYNNYNKITILGSSIVTINSSNNTPLIINGTIDGETSSSVLRVAGCFYQGTMIEPMNTGAFNPNYAITSVIGYVFNGNYTMPYLNYSSLVVRGIGIKTLNGNTTINGTLSINSAGKLELSGFDFTVNGATTLQAGGLSKNTLAGYTLFKGNLLMDGTSTFAINSASTVELQNSLSYDNSNGLGPITFAAGSLLKFTTRNQSIDNGHVATAFWNCDILVSGAITISNNLWGFGISGVLNGDNANSTFNNLGKFTYGNAQQPMLTGVIMSNLASANCIFVYSLASSQDLRSGIYTNLVLSGNGTKKLLGNVSVLNNYLLAPITTLNNNGFTLTNP